MTNIYIMKNGKYKIHSVNVDENTVYEEMDKIMMAYSPSQIVFCNEFDIVTRKMDKIFEED